MSNSSLENRLNSLWDRLQTENNSRDRDRLPMNMDSPLMPSSRNRPSLTLGNSNSGTPTRRLQLNLPLPYQDRNLDATETDNKLKEIMKISGILTIGGVKYRTNISEMEHIGELGSGTCGQVVKMRHIPSGEIIAVKQMRRSGNSEENKRIIMDIDVVLKSHDCPFIVQCLGCFITDSDVWICMELMATCFDKLLKRLKMSIPEYVLGKVTFATVKALSYLKEQHDVIHRDVKPSNILVDERGNVKLCDFGISGRLVDSMAKTRSAGCAAYMAPERIEPPNPSKPDYDIRADVWSLGITLVELATGVFPYKDCKTDFEVLTKVLSEEPPALPHDQEFSDEFRAFVACCLIKNYLDRPKYVKLLEEPFLKRYEMINVNVDDWFKRALKQADLLGANSPGRRYTPAPSNSSTRRHISLQHRNITDSQQHQQLSNGGSVGLPYSTPNVTEFFMPIDCIPNNVLPPDGRSLSNSFSPEVRSINSALPPDGRSNYPRHTTFPQFNHQRDSSLNHLPLLNQRSPEKQFGFLQNQSVEKRINLPSESSGRFSPFQRRFGESPPDDITGRFSPSPRRRDNTDLHDVNRILDQNTTPISSPFQQRRANLSDRLMNDGFWSSPMSSPLPIRKHYQNSPVMDQQYNRSSNTSPILLQRFFHQQKQYQQQAAAAQSDYDPINKDDSGGKKRFASHIQLQLVGDRCLMKSSRHQSPEPPPRLSRGSSTENSFISNNQSPLPARRTFLDTSSAASPSLSRRYISPSPPQPPPRRLSESNSVPGSPQHLRARFHYTPEPQRRVFHNSDVS